MGRAVMSRHIGGIMRVGTVVTPVYTPNYLGVVVGHWIHDISEEHYWWVHWVTGKFTGDTDAFLECDLEVLCE